MTVKQCFLLVALFAASASAVGVKVVGTLTDSSGTPIVNAAVSLINAGLSGVTDEDGMFGIYGDVNESAMKNTAPGRAVQPAVAGNAVVFTVGKSCANVRLDAFNARGVRIYSTALRNPSPGVKRLEIKSVADGLVLIRLAIDDKISVLKTNTLAAKPAAFPALNSAADKSVLSKETSAAIDTLKIAATGYKTRLIPIASYQLNSVKLSLYKAASVIVDTAKVSSKQDFLTLVKQYRDLYYGQCYGAEKTSVDSALATLTGAEPFLSAAAGRLSTSAVILMGKGLGLHASVVFAAAAAQTEPDSATYVNNFGAVVRMLNLDSDAVKILLYANNLHPKAPAILTNLANTLLEMGDDMKAESYYRQALAVNSQYGPAHQGLGMLYLSRMDYLAAINEFLAAAEFAFYGSSTKAISGSETICGGVPDGPFGQETGDATGTGDPSNPDQSSLAADDQLYIPPYKKWNGIDQFVADNDDIKRWNDDVSGGMYASLNWALDMSKQVNNLDSAGMAKFANDIIFYNREIYGEQCLQAYFSDRINQRNGQDSAATAALDKALKTSLDQAGSAETSQLNALGAQPEPADLAAVAAWKAQWEQITVDYNKKVVVAYDDYFGAWEVIQRNSYNATKQELEEFWLYTEPFMKQLYCGGLAYQMVDNSRRGFVYTQIYKYTGALPMLVIGYLGAYETAKALSQMPPDPTTPAAIDSTKVPKEKEPPCPFDKTPFTAGGGIVQVTIDCESAEIEGGEGIIGAAKYNFKKKETTLFLGVGAEACLGTKQFGVDAGAKAGGYVTFDQNGAPTDGGLKGDITAGGHMGNAGVSSKAELTGSAVTGVDLELSNRAGVYLGIGVEHKKLRQAPASDTKANPDGLKTK